MSTSEGSAVHVGVPYACTACHRTEYRPVVPPALGGSDGSARVAGWRFGPGEPKTRAQLCPCCSGVREGYWDSRDLREWHNAAAAAGIDPGDGIPW